ncbi:MAG: hypothetical protein ACYC5F_09660 [Thermoleophilia bacterium]
MTLPTLEDLGVSVHSDLEFTSGPIDCDGELEVMDVFARGQWVDLECHGCKERISMKRPPDLSWQERADLR